MSSKKAGHSVRGAEQWAISGAHHFTVMQFGYVEVVQPELGRTYGGISEFSFGGRTKNAAK